MTLKGVKMPVATIRVDDTDRFELKSLPSGYVVLRRMTYGQSLERRTLMKLTFNTRKGQKNLEGELAMANRRVQMYEFSHCIVEHNLTDDMERQLNLSDPVVLDRLDPRVGQEIESLISDMNSFEDDEDEKQGN
jgi:hypothetical protein